MYTPTYLIFWWLRTITMYPNPHHIPKRIVNQVTMHTNLLQILVIYLLLELLEVDRCILCRDMFCLERLITLSVMLITWIELDSEIKCVLLGSVCVFKLLQNMLIYGLIKFDFRTLYHRERMDAEFFVVV